VTFAEAEAELARFVEAGYGLLVLDSFEEKRGLAVAQVAADKAKLPLLTWSVSRGMTPPAKGLTLADALTARSQKGEPGLLALLGPQLSSLTPIERRLLSEAVVEGPSKRQHILAIAPIGDLPEELEREAGIVSLSPPDEAELKRTLEEVAKSMQLDLVPAAEAVAAARGLGLEEARRVFRLALLAKGEMARTIVAEKRRILMRNSAIDCIELGADELQGLSMVGGLDALKKWLADRRKSLAEEARAFGLPPPKGLLLLGVQGCGKSLSAKAIPAEWRMPLCRLDLAGLFSQRESPSATLRRTIASVEAMAPIVLWIDELEKVFAGLEGGRDTELMRVFGWFIMWLGERRSPVFVVATANDVTHLPPELLRRGRFDETFFVDLPNEAARAEILNIHLRQRGRHPEALPVAAIAKRSDKFSGAELEQLIVAALHLAFSNGRDLLGEDLWNAMYTVVPLYRVYEEKIRALRTWAQDRARPATSRQADRLALAPGAE